MKKLLKKVFMAIWRIMPKSEKIVFILKETPNVANLHDVFCEYPQNDRSDLIEDEIYEMSGDEVWEMLNGNQREWMDDKDDYVPDF